MVWSVSRVENETHFHAAQTEDGLVTLSGVRPVTQPLRMLLKLTTLSVASIAGFLDFGIGGLKLL